MASSAAASCASSSVVAVVLRHAIETAHIALGVCGRHWIETKYTWPLNETHYGAARKNKTPILAEFGEEQFTIWRRSDDTPPPIKAGSDFDATGLRYADVPSEIRPRTECLMDVLECVLPHWYDHIVPDLQADTVVLIAAHGSSLRAIVKHLDQISDEAVVRLNIPIGIPLHYEPDDDVKPTTAGSYLDPEAAAIAVEAVKNQGRK